MTQPLMKGEHWGTPYNRTPDRDAFGGHEPERRSSRDANSSRDGRWRGAVIAVTISASLMSGLAIGRSSATALPLGDNGRQAAPKLDFTDRLLDTNGPENRGR